MVSSRIRSLCRKGYRALDRRHILCREAEQESVSCRPRQDCSFPTGVSCLPASVPPEHVRSLRGDSALSNATDTGQCSLCGAAAGCVRRRVLFLCGVTGKHFAYNECPVATVSHGFTHEIFRPIHFCCVYHGQAKVEPPTQGTYFFAASPSHFVSTLSERAYLLSVREGDKSICYLECSLRYMG